jgi:hypothetical protein
LCRQKRLSPCPSRTFGHATDSLAIQTGQDRQQSLTSHGAGGVKRASASALEQFPARHKGDVVRSTVCWKYHRSSCYGRLYRENERLSKFNDRLKGEKENLQTESKDYRLLRKVFGNRRINDLLAQA